MESELWRMGKCFIYVCSTQVLMVNSRSFHWTVSPRAAGPPCLCVFLATHTVPGQKKKIHMSPRSERKGKDSGLEISPWFLLSCWRSHLSPLGLSFPICPMRKVGLLLSPSPSTSYNSQSSVPFPRPPGVSRILLCNWEISPPKALLQDWLLWPQLLISLCALCLLRTCLRPSGGEWPHLLQQLCWFSGRTEGLGPQRNREMDSCFSWI